MENESAKLSSHEPSEIKQEPEVHFVLILPRPEGNFIQKFIKVEPKSNQEEKKAEEKFPCQLCFKSFTSRRSLTIHQRSHEPKVKCKICSKDFRKNILKNHIKQKHETETKKLRCDLCPYTTCWLVARGKVPTTKNLVL